MFGRFLYLTNNVNLFHADFTTLSNGGTSQSTFNSTFSGLSFARATVSTVQTSASAIDSTPGINYACVGSIDGTSRGLVLQPNTFQVIGAAVGNNAPRDFTNATWNAGSGVTTTPSYAAGPDGIPPGVGCSRIQVSSGGYGNYGNVLIGTNYCWSSWQRSTNPASNGDMQQVWILATPGDGNSTVVSATSTWNRIIQTNGTSSRQYADVVDGRDYTGSGGQSARARDILVDYAQFERGDIATECIALSQTTRNCEVLKHTNAASLADNNRMKVRYAFYPKGGSGAVTWDSLFNGAQAYWYLFSCANGGTPTFATDDYVRINTSTLKIETRIAGTTATSTNAISFSANQLVEIYLELGASIASVCKYRINGGSWTDLVLSHTYGNYNPSGDFYLWSSGVGGSTVYTIPCWAKEIQFYNRYFTGF